MTPQRPKRIKERRRALVTGGAVRVGRAIALALAEAGMDVAIGYHRSAAEARRTLRAIRERGGRGVALRADLADPRAARRLVVEAARRLGGLDVLVNNAAIFVRSPFGAVTPARYERTLAVNLEVGVFLQSGGGANHGTARRAHREYRGRRARPTVAQLSALRPGQGRHRRPDSGPGRRAGAGPDRRQLRGARPSPTPTRLLTSPLDGSHPRAIAAQPHDVGAAVLFFATCPPHITGQVLRVDGGKHP